MKKLKTKLALTAGLALAPVAGTVAALASCSDVRYKEYHILTINDLHGAVPGYGEDVSVVDKSNPGCFRLQKEMNKILNKHPESVVLSAGDENSGDSWTTCSHGQTVYPVLKAMGVRYCAVGNHAFEWGLDDMSTGRYDRLGRTDQTEGQYFVSSNIFSVDGYNKYTWCTDETNPQFQSDFALWNKLRVSWADPYKMLKFGDCNVCLIGLTTTGTIEDSRIDVTQHMSFVDYNASIHYTKALAKIELGDEKYNAIDSFILFTHCGGQWDDTKKQVTGEVADLAANADTDFDAILSAHTHKQFAGTITNKKTGKQIWMAQGGTAARAFTDTKILFNPMEKPGKRLASISMEVKKVEVPTDLEVAKKEWEEFRNANGDMSSLAEAYNYERKWVYQLLSPRLSKANLKEDPEYMQAPDKFKGYYNSLVDGISHITKQKVIPGHDYWCSPKILDHYGAWMARGLQLGFYSYYKETIKSQYGVMPSCCFVTQDSAPTNLANGDISVRETYNMIPYDNKVAVSYLSIYQLANVFNYLLSGYTSEDQEEGFVYQKNHNFQPDLNSWYGGTNDCTQTQVGSDKTQYNSYYLCGPLTWSGIQVEIAKIDATEKGIKRDKLIPTEEEKQALVFDNTATYRVATTPKTFSNGKTINIPNIRIFEYKMNTDGTDNIADLDKPETWTKPDSWYDFNTGDVIKLIPVLTNDFIYKGRNDQFKMFKDYQEYNQAQAEFKKCYSYIYEWTVREDITHFLSNGIEEGYDWKDDKFPVNITWTDAQKLIIWPK